MERIRDRTGTKDGQEKGKEGLTCSSKLSLSLGRVNRSGTDSESRFIVMLKLSPGSGNGCWRMESTKLVNFDMLSFS